jgi:hypothetical protein
MLSAVEVAPRPPRITTPIGAWISLPGASIRRPEHQRDQREAGAQRGHEHRRQALQRAALDGLVEARALVRRRCS